MKTTEEVVTELADREAIRDLPVRYCDCVWRGDITGIVDLFTEDGMFVIRGHNRDSVTKGSEALRKMYGAGLGNLSPRPYIHNHVIELVDASRATGRCYVELRTAARNMEWIGTGFYHDEYAKVGDRWHFQSRNFEPVRLDAAPDAPLPKKAKPVAKKAKPKVAPLKVKAPAKKAVSRGAKAPARRR